MQNTLTESERTFFERARPDFEKRIAAGEKPNEALKAAACGVVKRDEDLFLALHGVGGGGKEAAEALKSAMAAIVYNRLRSHA